MPEHILLKPGPLSADEREIMESHPLIGERICAPLKSFRMVLHPITSASSRAKSGWHRIDPDKLSGRDKIPIARIMQMVWIVFDALTTNRPYQALRFPQKKRFLSILR